MRLLGEVTGLLSKVVGRLNMKSWVLYLKA